MAIEPTPPHPERARLEALIAIVEKRVARAAEKRRAAEREMDDALDALEAKRVDLAVWVEANPEAQGELL